MPYLWMDLAITLGLMVPQFTLQDPNCFKTLILHTTHTLEGGYLIAIVIPNKGLFDTKKKAWLG